jgi:hypothetical protein
MPLGPPLVEHDVLAVGSEVNVSDETIAAGHDGSLRHGDTPSQVESDQFKAGRIRFGVSRQPEFIVAGPTDGLDVWRQLGQRDQFPTDNWMDRWDRFRRRRPWSRPTCRRGDLEPA